MPTRASGCGGRPAADRTISSAPRGPRLFLANARLCSLNRGRGLLKENPAIKPRKQNEQVGPHLQRRGAHGGPSGANCSSGEAAAGPRGFQRAKGRREEGVREGRRECGKGGGSAGVEVVVARGRGGGGGRPGCGPPRPARTPAGGPSRGGEAADGKEGPVTGRGGRGWSIAQGFPHL